MQAIERLFDCEKSEALIIEDHFLEPGALPSTNHVAIRSKWSGKENKRLYALVIIPSPDLSVDPKTRCTEVSTAGSIASRSSYIAGCSDREILCRHTRRDMRVYFEYDARGAAALAFNSRPKTNDSSPPPNGTHASRGVDGDFLPSPVDSPKGRGASATRPLCHFEIMTSRSRWVVAAAFFPLDHPRCNVSSYFCQGSDLQAP